MTAKTQNTVKNLGGLPPAPDTRRLCRLYTCVVHAVMAEDMQCIQHLCTVSLSLITCRMCIICSDANMLLC